MYQFDTLHLWTYPGCLQEKTPLTRRLTDPNHITQTPSGTLSNTALTLIQVLKLYRGLAVINFNYGLLTLACSYEDENDRQNLKWSEAVFLALRFLLFCVRLLGFFLFFLSISCLFSIFSISGYSILWMSIFFSVRDCCVFVSTPFSLKVPWLLLCLLCHRQRHLALCGYKAPT